MNRKQFERIVKNLVVCSVDDSWKGGGDPDAIPEIEADLRRARAIYRSALDDLFPPELKEPPIQPRPSLMTRLMEASWSAFPNEDAMERINAMTNVQLIEAIDQIKSGAG